MRSLSWRRWKWEKNRSPGKSKKYSKRKSSSRETETAERIELNFIQFFLSRKGQIAASLIELLLNQINCHNKNTIYPHNEETFTMPYH